MTFPVLLLSAVLSSTAGQQAPQPNIVIIMVDDMGWSDLGCYGGEIETPHIDALAEQGLRFSSFYNTGRCCPTRASLLTGLYPHQTGVGKMTFDEKKPGYRGFLQPNCVTIAEMLRSSGYRTSMVGKWHLSLTVPGTQHMKFLNNQATLKQFGDPETYPVARGFENYYGVIWGVVNFFDPFSLVQDTTPITSVPDDYYITDAFTDSAIERITEYSQGDDPFFLYLAYTAPHWPLHARNEDILKYNDTYKVGWQAIRKARYQRQLDMELLKKDSAVLSSRHDPNLQWEQEPERAWEARAMAVHAAMIDRVDQSVGRIVETLRKHNQLDNTLILFLSDNGASPERPGAPGFDRNSQTRDGQPVTYFGPGQPKTIMPGPETTYAGIGPRWANVANTPFRLWKAAQHEGGIRTPLIAYWPAGIQTKPGAITHQPGHIIDLMATSLELAGVEYPTQFNNHDITPLAGKSLLPVFQGKQRDGHEAIFFEHYGNKAVRRGDWKLVSYEEGTWELYNITNDQTETEDLAARHPELVKHLQQLWSNWAKRAQVTH